MPQMTKILVIHGAGMSMRGKAQVEVFGPMTLPEYDAAIRGYAAALGVEVEIFHSNLEGEVIDRVYAAHDDTTIDAAIINPDGFTRGYPRWSRRSGGCATRRSRCTCPTQPDAGPRRR